MTDTDIVSIRIPADSLAGYRDAADDLGVSLSEYLRDCISRGHAARDDLDGSLKAQARRQQIKRDAKPKQFRAHFRQNVAQSLRSKWKATPRMTPEEVEQALSGYAEEVEAYSDEKKEWFKRALACYAVAYETGDQALLTLFLTTGEVRDTYQHRVREEYEQR